MKIVLTISFLFCSQLLFGQEYLDIIAKKTCDCAAKIPSKVKGNRRTIRLGLCMIKVAGAYKKDFKKDFGLEFGKQRDQEEIGKLIGEKMAVYCPNTLLSMVTDEQVDRIMSEDDEELELGTTSGKLLNIENKGFIVFELKNNAVNSSKYYWLGKIDTDIPDFNNAYYNLVGDQVEIQFEKFEFFDPKLNDYRKYKIIKSIYKK